MGSLALLVAKALLAWGVLNPPVPINIEFYENDNGQLAQAGCSDTQCLIGVNRQQFSRASEDEQFSVILHEVGHTLVGPEHYGSCNHNESIMGCATLGRITDYDRFMLKKEQGKTYSLRVAMVANE